MKSTQERLKELYFYITIAGLFLLINCHSWLSDGMFMDGTVYAVLARNLANGSATFWHPHLTNTLYPVFVEHPPLATGLQSIFFKILGDSRFVERIYSMLTALITAMMIVSIWKQIVKKSTNCWFPVLIWVTIPTVLWASVNNMLENTLVIFICLSVLFYLKSRTERKLLFLVLSGVMLSLGFLTKGFVTFTPLAFPFFLWLFLRNQRFLPMIADTAIILISSLVPLLFLYLFTGGHDFLPKYIDMAINKIAKGETASSRFYIDYRLLMDLLPGICIILVMMIFYIKKRISFKQNTDRLKYSLAFLSLGLAGVLPIMLTLDQSDYFLLLSFPFFAISFALVVDPLINLWSVGIDIKSRGFLIFRWSGIIMLSAGLILSLYFSGDFNRDRNKLSDMRIILPELNEGTTISILPGMYSDWSLHTYYARYKNISLDADPRNNHDFLLVRSTMYSDTLNKGFTKIPLDTKEYVLFRRKN